MAARIILMLSVLGLGVLMLACRGKQVDSEEEGLKQIEELHRKDLEASKVKDFKTLLSLWEDDGVLLEPGRAPIIGKDAIKAYIESQAETSKTYRITKYEQDWKEIRIIGDWAFEWGVFEGEAELINGGPPIKQKAKMLRLLKRQNDGSWKCARVIYHEDPAED